ncbi:hypothetical protein, partial [Streptomyces cacaoi]
MHHRREVLTVRRDDRHPGPAALLTRLARLPAGSALRIRLTGLAVLAGLTGLSGLTGGSLRRLAGLTRLRETALLTGLAGRAG